MRHCKDESSRATEASEESRPVKLVAVLLALIVSLAALAQPAQASDPVKVNVIGVYGDVRDNVLASLSLLQRSHLGDITVETIVELHGLAKNEITRALQPFGYYRPDIETGLREPPSPGSPWLATYTINPGPPVPIAELAIDFYGEGKNDPELAKIAAELSLQQDASLDHRHYEAAKKDLIRALQDRGYLDAALVRPRVEVDLASYSANIELEVRTGPRYVVGAIEFEQDRFHPEYLAKYLILETGEPFNSARVARQRTVLSRSGHFQEVQILPQPATAGPQPAIPLRIVLQPSKPNRYRGQLGWGTDTGLGVRVDWTRRHVGGRGQHFNLGVAAAEERNRLAGDLSYMIPVDPLSGHDVELVVRHESKDLTYQDVELDEGGESRIATNLASTFWHLPRRMWGDFEVQSMAGLSLVTETYDVFEVLFGNLPDSAQQAIIESIGPQAYATLAPDFEAVVPNLRLTLRRSDNPLYIRRGDYLNLELLGANDNLGSNISFWQARLYSWHIRPLGEKGRLLARASAGYSDAESRNVLDVNFNQMPEYYEFRVGGARSVRGYGFETLYPSDAITGGKHQLVASIEYEHEVIPDWGLAVFLDGGNAFNSFDDFDPKLGTGIGLRWRSPVGLARVDLGFPLDDADESFQIYITVGPEF